MTLVADPNQRKALYAMLARDFSALIHKYVGKMTLSEVTGAINIHITTIVVAQAIATGTIRPLQPSTPLTPEELANLLDQRLPS